MSELEVLVAHDNPGMREEIQQALTGHVERLAVVASGHEALSRLLRDHPRVLVVDVALPGRAPFELCDDIHQAGLRTRVVLVASVYNRTRYKRRPTSLYGADDYVEQHHIHDMLPVKVTRLMAGLAPAVSFELSPVDPAAAARVREAGDEMLTIRFQTVEEGQRRAARLCELIVADVALYNGEALAELARLEDAAPQLSADLDEARSIFERLVPLEVRGGRDWIGDQFAALLKRRPARLSPVRSGGDGRSGDGRGDGRGDE